MLTIGRNYFRYTLIALARWNKPIIVTGTYSHPKNGKQRHATFLNIHPYVYAEGKKIVTECICDHININYNELISYYGFTRKNNGEQFYLICLANVYKDDDGYERGGLELTDRVLPIPVIPAYRENWLRVIPKELYVDFTRVFEGRYAWEKGHKTWKPQTERMEEKRKEERKPKKKKKQGTYVMPYTSKKLVIPECPLNLPRKTGAAISMLSNQIAKKYKGMENLHEVAMQDVLRRTDI